MKENNINDTELKKLIDSNDWWYHTMDLGFGIQTPGHYGENLIPIAALMQNIKFNDLYCLDIGTMDGKMAFLMEKLGGKVIAVDVLKRDTVSSLVDHFGSLIHYEYGIRERDFPKVRESFGLFDFVLCSGILYHVYSPFDLILEARKLVKNGGCIVFESACLPDEVSLTMTLNHGDIYNEHTTIWLPSIACLRYMIKYSAFKILAESTLNYPSGVPRHAILAQALKPSELKHHYKDDAWLKTLYSGEAPGLSHFFLLPQYDLEFFEGMESTNVKVADFENKLSTYNLNEETTYIKEMQFLNIYGTPAKLNR